VIRPLSEPLLDEPTANEGKKSLTDIGQIVRYVIRPLSEPLLDELTIGK